MNPWLRRSVRAVSLALAVVILTESSYRVYLWALAGAQRESGVFDLYAVGDSTTLGRPYDRESSFAAQAVRMLEGQASGRRIVLHMLASPGDSAYPQALRLRKAMRFRRKANPAAVLIYSGNNEILSTPQRLRILHRGLRFLKERVVVDSLALSDALLILERALDQKGIRDLGSFEFYLRRMVESSAAGGALPILSTVMTNVAGIEPQLPPLEEQRHDGVSQLMSRGLALEGRASYRQAADLYEGALRKDPSLRALVHYRLGRLSQARGDYRGARRHYWEAVDADPQTAYGRATTRHNEVVRRVAREYGIPLVDAVRLFEGEAPHGLVGNEFFVDGYHPNLRGQRLLAGAFSEILASRFGGPPGRTAGFNPGPARHDCGAPEESPDQRLYAGTWRVLYYFDHPAATRTFALAETCLRGALRERPDRYWGWVALGLAEGLRKSPPLKDKRGARWVADLLWYPRPSALGKEKSSISAALRDLGASEKTLAGLEDRVEKRREDGGVGEVGEDQGQ